MKSIWAMLCASLLLPNPSFGSEKPIKVALSYEMLNGLTEEAQCLERVESVLDDLQIEDVPWLRIMLNLEHGKSDLTPCVFKTPKREDYIDFIGPIADLYIVMVSPDTKGYELADIGELRGIFLRGTSLIKEYTTPVMKVSEANGIDNLLKFLKSGRADYSLMPGNFVKNRNTDGLEVKTIKTIPLYIGISKKSPRRFELLHLFKDRFNATH